jgi:hypothetical protein
MWPWFWKNFLFHFGFFLGGDDLCLCVAFIMGGAICLFYLKAFWERFCGQPVVISMCVCVCLCVCERERDRERERERERERDLPASSCGFSSLCQSWAQELL